MDIRDKDIDYCIECRRNTEYRLSKKNFNEKHYLYLASMLNKQTENYSYTNARITKKIKNESIKLPVILSSNPSHTYTINDIDFDYMEKYIRAIEKQTIASVYEGRGKIIEKTKETILL